MTTMKTTTQNQQNRVQIARDALNAIDQAIAAGADDWSAPEGWEPGDEDGCWSHPAAADARRLTDALGLQWDFSSWADTRLIVADIVDEFKTRDGVILDGEPMTQAVATEVAGMFDTSDGLCHGTVVANPEDARYFSVKVERDGMVYMASDDIETAILTGQIDADPRDGTTEGGLALRQIDDIPDDGDWEVTA